MVAAILYAQKNCSKTADTHDIILRSSEFCVTPYLMVWMKTGHAFHRIGLAVTAENAFYNSQMENGNQSRCGQHENQKLHTGW